MSEPYLVKPDRDFLHCVLKNGGGDLKKCYQCATCSVVCELSGERNPFPRKEMIWAQWGLKDRLVADPDVWLCHQCNDCSTHCPRGARPGDVMATIRRQTIIHYAVPGFLGKWVNDPKFAPLVLLIPTVLVGLLFLSRIENTLGEKIIFSYYNLLPHWVLIGFFAFFSLLSVAAMTAGVVRFWQAMKAADAREETTTAAKGLGSSIVSVLRSVILHDKFTLCTTDRSRALSHLCVFYGFIALLLVTFWVMTARFNPLIRHDFVYPFSFWSPWRMLANLGGVAMAAGCLLIILDRWTKNRRDGTSTYFDWAFVGTLLAVVLTGFVCEVLHYVRLEPHRFVAYFIHLVFVFTLLMYLPYCKFAHVFYRITAMVYAEYSGRSGPAGVAVAGKQPEGEQEEKEGKDEESAGHA